MFLFLKEDHNGQNKMKPGALGIQDHVHTCVLFIKEFLRQNYCFQNSFTT